MTYSGDASDCFLDVLRDIARGRTDNGRPLAAENSRQIARSVLIRFGVSWARGDSEEQGR